MKTIYKSSQNQSNSTTERGATLIRRLSKSTLTELLSKNTKTELLKAIPTRHFYGMLITTSLEQENIMVRFDIQNPLANISVDEYFLIIQKKKSEKANTTSTAYNYRRTLNILDCSKQNMFFQGKARFFVQEDRSKWSRLSPNHIQYLHR